MKRPVFNLMPMPYDAHVDDQNCTYRFIPFTSDPSEFEKYDPGFWHSKETTKYAKIDIGVPGLALYYGKREYHDYSFYLLHEQSQIPAMNGKVKSIKRLLEEIETHVKPLDWSIPINDIIKDKKYAQSVSTLNIHRY